MKQLCSLLQRAAVVGGFLLAGATAALAQGFSGTLAPGHVYGNASGVEAKPTDSSIGAILDRALAPGANGILTRVGPQSYLVQPFPLPLALGGTGAKLTVSPGAVAYSTGLSLALLPAPLALNLPLLSGGAAPVFGAVAYPASAISGGVAYFSSGSAMASSPQLAANGPMIGGGAGAAPSAVTAGSNGQVFLGVTGGPPAFAAMSGDATITNSGVVTIGAGAVGNSKLANAGAFTFKGNATGSSAAPTDFTVASLTNKVTPTGSDLIMIADAAASNATKYATITQIIGAVTSGVSSIAGNTGAFTLSTGLINSTNDLRVDIATATGIWSATANKIIDSAGFNTSLALTSLTDAATIATDMATGTNFTVTLAGNRTLGNPTNTQVGRTGCYYIVQDGTGSRTLAYASSWKFIGGTAPTLTTTINAVDALCYHVRSSTFIVATLLTNVK